MTSTAYRSALHRRQAFTLLELLVATSIVVALVLLVNQLISSASSTTTLSQKKMDAVSQAQLVLDRMAFDFTQMPVRTDLDYGFSKFEGNDSFSFYSYTEGLYPSSSASPTPRNISVVGYQIVMDSANGKAPVLQRGARQLDWNTGGPAGIAMAFTLVDGTGGQIQKLDPSAANNTLPPVDPTGATVSNYQIFGDQVFRLEICYLIKGDKSLGTTARLSVTPPTSISNLSAIVVAIAVLDAKSRVIVKDYSGLISALDDPKDTDLQQGKDILALWSSVINSPDFAQKSKIPAQAAQSVRIFQRYFYLE